MHDLLLPLTPRHAVRHPKITMSECPLCVWNKRRQVIVLEFLHVIVLTMKRPGVSSVIICCTWWRKRNSQCHLCDVDVMLPGGVRKGILAALLERTVNKWFSLDIECSRWQLLDRATSFAFFSLSPRSFGDCGMFVWLLYECTYRNWYRWISYFRPTMYIFMFTCLIPVLLVFPIPDLKFLCVTPTSLLLSSLLGNCILGCIRQWLASSLSLNHQEEKYHKQFGAAIEEVSS